MRDVGKDIEAHSETQYKTVIQSLQGRLCLAKCCLLYNVSLTWQCDSARPNIADDADDKRLGKSNNISMIADG